MTRRLLSILISLGLFGLVAGIQTTSAEEPGRHSSKELTVLDKDGSSLLQKYLLRQIHQQYDVRRKDVAAAHRSAEAARKRQKELRARMRKILGPFPEKTPLRPRVTGKIEGDGYRIEKVVFESRPKHYVTANLYLPTRSKPPFRAVTVACGHSSQGKAYSAYQSACILLARHGFATLIYDPVGQGERRQLRGGPGNAGFQHKLMNVNGLLVGRNLVAVEAWDGIRSIDYLLSRPEVARDKPVGMTGNSGGGAQTMYLMAIDDRIAAAAPSCHITTLERNFELGVAGDGCQSAPFTGFYGIDHPDFLAMRAPKPTIILAAVQDYKDIVFTRKTFREAKALYELLGKPENVDLFAYDDKHAFSRPRREAAVRWMNRWLHANPGPVKEPELKLQSEKALQVTSSGQVLKEFRDALSVPDLNLRRAKELKTARETFWKNKSKAVCLAEVRKLIGARLSLGKIGVVRRGVVTRNGYSIQKLLIERDGEIPLPALLFTPAGAKGKLPATLMVDDRGKAAAAGTDGTAVKLVRDGRIVLSVDLRGFGETADAPSKTVFATGDHRTAMWSFHIGRTLLGQRVEDLLTAARVLSAQPHVDGDHLQLIARGKAGPVALHAAVLGDRFEQVTLQNSMRSWVNDVVARPLKRDVIGSVVPFALEKYDLPDLAKLLAKRLSWKE